MGHDLLLLSPLLIAAFLGLLFLGLEVFRTGDERGYMGLVGAFGYGVAGLLVAWMWKHGGEFRLALPWLRDMLVVNRFTLMIEALVLVSAAATSLVAVPYLRARDLARGEFHALLAFAVVGMLAMASARDLVALFVGLEVMSLAVYVLVAYERSRSYLAVEAALKYFLLGSVAAAVLLLAIAFLYGLSGTTELAGLAAFFRAHPDSATGASARLVTALLVVAMGFKVALVPFHFWTPDAYQGAPTPLTGFMASGVKVAGFAILLRVFLHVFQADAFYASKANWMALLYGLAMLTMLVGNVTAIVQTNVKRMLGYSSIAHAGYVLIGVITVTAGGGGLKAVSAAVGWYLAAYVLANLVAFGVLSLLDDPDDANLDFERLNGVARRHPVLGAALALSLVSLAGIPPAAGFFAKFSVFRDALTADTALFLPLVLVAVLASLVSVYYYLRPLVHLYMHDEGPRSARAQTFAPAHAALAVLALAILWAGVFPSRLTAWSERALGNLVVREARAAALEASPQRPNPGAVLRAPAPRDEASATPSKPAGRPTHIERRGPRR